jgi:Zn ribbon nucleic-acid-binding protein
LGEGEIPALDFIVGGEPIRRTPMLHCPDCGYQGKENVWLTDKMGMDKCLKCGKEFLFERKKPKDNKGEKPSP